MRTKFLLFLMITSLLTTGNKAYAQTILLDPALFYVGTSHGVTASRGLFSPSVSQDFTLGYNGGIGIRYITEKHFGLQLELNYVQRGWTESENGNKKVNEYIDMPFLTHITFGVNAHRLFFNIGPRIGYLINETANFKKPSSATLNKKIDHPFDYGITAGIGYGHQTNIGIFQIETRGYWGLNDAYANTKKDPFFASNYLTIGVNIGWYISIGE